MHRRQMRLPWCFAQSRLLAVQIRFVMASAQEPDSYASLAVTQLLKLVWEGGWSRYADMQVVLSQSNAKTFL